MEYPKTRKEVEHATIRECEDGFHIECRMSDGQKGAFIIVDLDYPELANTVVDSLKKDYPGLAAESPFSIRLRIARTIRNMSQAKLSKLAELHPSAISHFEGGRRKPNLANIIKLAKALNCTSDFLIGLSNKL